MGDKEKAFLIGLEKLTRETGVEIWGCGCCGSPGLSEADTSDPRSGYLMDPESSQEIEWLTPKDRYDWERKRHKIVKEG